MKRNGFYLLLLLVIAGLTYFFVFREPGDGFSRSEANFSVRDTAAVTAMFLSDMVGNSAKISREGSGWKLNDSFTARPDAVAFLLEALATQKPDQPVPSGFHDAAIRDLSANSAKIEVYQGKEKTHTFYVAKNPGYNNVTYMLTEGAKRPFIVKIPLRTNMFLGVRYLTRPADWRDRKILYTEGPIEEVQVSYRDSVQFSFTINNRSSQPAVSGNSTPATPLNLKRVQTYLGALNQVYCTGFEDRYLRKDSIIQHERQLGSITIRRQGGQQQQLTVFFKPRDKGTKGLMKVGGTEYDFDSFFGLLNGKDFLLISRKNVEKMFRSFPEFFEADAVPANAPAGN